jgi:hypothetical protein
MQGIFSTAALQMESWALILAASLLVVLVSEALKKIVPGLRL